MEDILKKNDLLRGWSFSFEQGTCCLEMLEEGSPKSKATAYALTAQTGLLDTHEGVDNVIHVLDQIQFEGILGVDLILIHLRFSTGWSDL